MTEQEIYNEDTNREIGNTYRWFIEFKHGRRLNGKIIAENRTKAVVFLLKDNQEIRRYFQRKYFLEFSELCELFGDIWLELEDVKRRYYDYLWEKEDTDINIEKDLNILYDTPDVPILTDTERLKLIKYFEDIKKYKKLIDIFLERKFEVEYNSLSNEEFEHLSKVILIDNSLKILEF